MKITLLGVLLVSITVLVLGAAVVAPGSKATAQDKITMKDDFSKENAK